MLYALEVCDMPFRILHHFHGHVIQLTASGIVHRRVAVSQYLPITVHESDIRKDEHDIPLKLVKGSDGPIPDPGSNSLEVHRSLDDIIVIRCLALQWSDIDLTTGVGLGTHLADGLKENVAVSVT